MLHQCRTIQYYNKRQLIGILASALQPELPDDYVHNYDNVYNIVNDDDDDDDVHNDHNDDDYNFDHFTCASIAAFRSLAYLFGSKSRPTFELSNVCVYIEHSTILVK